MTDLPKRNQNNHHSINQPPRQMGQANQMKAPPLATQQEMVNPAQLNLNQQYVMQMQQDDMMNQHQFQQMHHMMGGNEDLEDLEDSQLLLKIFEEGQFDNLTPELIQKLQQIIKEEHQIGLDFGQLQQLLQKDQTGMQANIEGLDHHHDHQAQLLHQIQNIQGHNIDDFDKQENHEFLNLIQSQMQGLDPHLSQDNELNDMQLLEALQNQSISFEQLQQLNEKGIDIQALEMAGVRIQNNQQFSEDELMARLQDMQEAQAQHQVPHIMSENELMLLQKELAKQNPEKSHKDIEGFIQNMYFDPLQEQAYKLAELINQENNINQDQPAISQPHLEFDQHQQDNQFPELLPKTEENISEHDFNLDEKLHEEQRLRDMYFEQQLRVFYKNMMERLPQTTMEKLSKKSKQFCEQINKVQTEFIQQRRQKKKQAKSKAKPQDRSDSSSHLEANEENDGNSSFYSVLYGQNSNLNPDPYLSEMLTCLNSYPDLKEQFKRFLPEDDEEIRELEQNVQKLKQNMNIDDVPMGTELDRSYDENSNMQKLKREAYQNLFKLLEEYAETKDKIKTLPNAGKQKQVAEALGQIGTKVMKVAENYQKYVSDEIKIQLEQNRSKKEQPNYLQQLEEQMSLILRVIPAEIIDSYNVQSSLAQPIKRLEDKKGAKPPPPRGRRGRSRAQLSDEDYEGSDAHRSEDAQDDSDGQQAESEEEEVEEEAEEEFEEEIEEEQEDEYPNAVEQQTPRNDRGYEDDDFTYYNRKPISAELAAHYPSKLKELNKSEVKVFDSLQKQMRSEQDWLSFNKLFLLYLDGVINLRNLFDLFEEKYGARITEDLQKELEQLLPTRDHSRRVGSDILKPWNDLENQKYEKQSDSCYYKIDPNFPLPICSAKSNPRYKDLYQPFLNERYLSLATGSENFKFKVRNINEDMIFKNEDDMHKLDTQLENFEKCYNIIEKEIARFDSIKDAKALKSYEFPASKLEPHMFFWEKRYKDLIPILMHKPFKREFLICLKQGLLGKLQELQNFKLDQQSVFEDVYRKNFHKSLDHRSFQYKDFMKKYQQKQAHIHAIRQVAAHNQCGERRHINKLKGSNSAASPFYHSFGHFLQHDFAAFDAESPDDFPMNMDYKNLSKLATQVPQKFPHLRLIVKDESGLKIAIKMLCLSIRYSTSHHNNERPRMTENCRFMLQEFFKVKEFKQLNQSCGIGKVDFLTSKQAEMILSKDPFLYYKLRASQLSPADKEFQQPKDHDLDGHRDLKPVKIQLSKLDADALHSPTKSLDLSAPDSAVKDKALSPSGRNEKDFSDNESEKSSSEMLREKVQDQYKELQVKSNQATDRETLQVDDLPFMPHFTSGYKLLYAPYNIFMFFKYFYAMYERIVMAKQLIREKVTQDMSELPMPEKQRLNLVDAATGKVKPDLIELFVAERYEYFLKGAFALTNHSHPPGTVVVGNHINSSTSCNVMDTNKFEDFCRVLLGKNAFLLFQVDKITNHALKQLHVMHSDSQCQKSIRLFKRFHEPDNAQNENFYMTQYAHEVIDQFSLSENVLNAKSFQLKADQECNHTSKKFESMAQGIDNDQNSRQTRQDALAASFAGANSATSANLSNFQAYRLMFSEKSKTMSIHYLNLNPFQLPLSNYRSIMRDNYKSLKETTMLPSVPSLDKLDDEQCECVPNKITEDLTHPPVFLIRNLKRMQKFRTKADIAEGTQVRINNLQMEVVPQINQILYNPAVIGEDVFVFKRKTKLFSDGKTMVIQDLEKTCEQSRQVLKRVKLC